MVSPMLARNIAEARIRTPIQGGVRRPVARRLRPFMRMSWTLGMVGDYCAAGRRRRGLLTASGWAQRAPCQWRQSA